MGLKTKRIGIVSGLLVLMFILVTSVSAQPPIPTPPLPPYFSDLTVTPSEIEIGDNVTISIDIRNLDNRSITYGVTMWIENAAFPPPFWPPYDVTLMIWVDLEAYESKTVSQNITLDQIGEYHVWVEGLTGIFKVGTWPPEPPLKPVEFILSDLSITPAEVELGEEVTITFTVTNVGEMKGGYTITMKTTPEITSCVSGPPPGLIFEAIDGEFKQYRTIAGGESETYEFIFFPEAEGPYDVSVDGMRGNFTVKAPPKPAEFVLSNFSYTSELQVGEPLRIYVDIANVGELAGETTIVIKIDGAIQPAPQSLQSLFQLGPEEVFSQVWTSYQPFEVGTHTIHLDGFEGTFNVIAEPVPFWTTPEFLMAVIVIIAAAVILYAYWKGILPSATTRSNSHVT